MRYIKVLVLAFFIFIILLFFFQNQGALSQSIPLELNLFFIPKIDIIPLPLYFLLITAFFIGCALAVLALAWDKVLVSSRLMKTKWRVKELQKENVRLQNELEKIKPAPAPAPAENGK